MKNKAWLHYIMDPVFISHFLATLPNIKTNIAQQFGRIAWAWNSSLADHWIEMELNYLAPAINNNSTK